VELLADPMFMAVAVIGVCLLGLSKGGFLGIGVMALPLMSLFVPPLQAAAIADITRAAASNGDADLSLLYAGQGLRLINEGQSAAQIVAQLITGAERLLLNFCL